MIKVVEHIPMPIGNAQNADGEFTTGIIDQALIMCGIELHENGDITLHIGKNYQYYVYAVQRLDVKFVQMVSRPVRHDPDHPNWPVGPIDVEMTEHMKRERDRMALPSELP